MCRMCPHEPVSQTLIMLNDNSTSTQGKFATGSPWQLTIFLMSYGFSNFWKSALTLFITVGFWVFFFFFFFAREAISVRVAFHCILVDQFHFVSNFWLLKSHRLVYFLLHFQRTDMLLGYNLHMANVHSVSEPFNVYPHKIYILGRMRTFYIPGYPFLVNPYQSCPAPSSAPSSSRLNFCSDFCQHGLV